MKYLKECIFYRDCPVFRDGYERHMTPGMTERQVEKMSSILEQLYAGDLAPAERNIQGNDEYDRLCRESVQEIREFSKKLDEQSRKAFEQLLEHYLELTYIEKSQTFCDGFRLGAGIMCEVFQGRPAADGWQ